LFAGTDSKLPTLENPWFTSQVTVPNVRNSGVGKVLQNKLQQDTRSITRRSLSLRLKLVVHDRILHKNIINHTRSFIDTLYAFFVSTSSVQFTKAARILDSYWIVSSFRSVSAVWKRYVTSITHFKEAAGDSQRTNV